jgi:hypothetical protein
MAFMHTIFEAYVKAKIADKSKKRVRVNRKSDAMTHVLV